ncbi:GNAT family N-acetyltransferase [Actinokineospora diospyrosa]|nr:GNAT family N-acetyltransferase [Actinokineospora diospyrosa]
MRIRHLVAEDWAAIAALEAATYGALSEGRTVLQSRAVASPETCFVLDAGERIAGYVLSLPYPDHRFPDLSEPEFTVHGRANLHLHDLVIAPASRGHGFGALLVDRVIEAAVGAERVSLVALEGTGAFWTARGFRALPAVATPGYGPGAVYMSRPITRRVESAGGTRRSQ